MAKAFEHDLSGAACAFGVFDGVHEGHRYLIDRAIADARARGEDAAIVTFDVDPTELFSPGVRDKLMTNDERISCLSDLGADALVVIPFTREVAALSPAGFLDALFASGAPSAIFVGADIRFGRAAQGALDDMVRWGSAHGMRVEGVPLLEREGAPITSTRIRGLLAQGEVEKAADLLGRPYSLEGEVVSGRQAGREMGICTANLSIPPLREAPADGVYAAYAKVDGERYKAAVSVGVPITFEGVTESTIEAHLLDFEGDLYGEPLTLEFARRLRPMIKFADADELVAQIGDDIAQTRLLL